MTLKKCFKEFCNLPSVAPDTYQHTSIGSCVFSAQHEIDLCNEGEIELTVSQFNKLQNFINKWEKHVEND